MPIRIESGAEDQDPGVDCVLLKGPGLSGQSMTTGSAWRGRSDPVESGQEPGRVGRCHEGSAMGESHSRSGTPLRIAAGSAISLDM